MIELSGGDYRLVLEPQRGGSIARFDWRGQPLMRPSSGPSILNAACFPLVPFSNRIAHGRFRIGEHEVRLSPNLPGSDHPHPLHGFGWLQAWSVFDAAAHHATLRHHYTADEWPWTYVSEQGFHVSPDGMWHQLSLRNLSETPMPAGLGFHPYFPRSRETSYRGLHRGEWQTSADGLPLALHEVPEAADWWDGEPVSSRMIDTVYTGREGHLEIAWPERNLSLAIRPSINLPLTVVFTPQDADYFCVEPVSHATDAINQPGSMNMLSPGETMSCQVFYRANELMN